AGKNGLGQYQDCQRCGGGAGQHTDLVHAVLTKYRGEKLRRRGVTFCAASPSLDTGLFETAHTQPLGPGREIMTIVVTGATGNVGRPLVSALVDAGAKVRAVSRQPQSAGLPGDVEVVESASEAIAGASAVFLNSRALGGELPAVVEQARREGVTRLVALSAINADDDFARQPSRFRGDRNKEVEQLAVDSGLEWVSLRPSVFATNFVGMWSAQIRTGDVVRGPYAAAASAPIVESDIAEV